MSSLTATGPTYLEEPAERQVGQIEMRENWILWLGWREGEY